MQVVKCLKRYMHVLENRSGQVASMDIIMATVMFLMVAAFILSYIFSGVTGDRLSALDGESRVILSTLVSSDADSSSQLQISEAGNLDPRALGSFIHRMLYTEGFYDDMKSEFNIENEFCVHIEDSDGNVVYLHELVYDDELIGLLLDESTTFPESVETLGLGSDVISIGSKDCTIA